MSIPKITKSDIENTTSVGVLIFEKNGYVRTLKFDAGTISDERRMKATSIPKNPYSIHIRGEYFYQNPVDTLIPLNALLNAVWLINDTKKIVVKFYNIVPAKKQYGGHEYNTTDEILVKKLEFDKEEMKGYKTAVYGKKSHRDNITQLENSVRKMF